MVADDGDDGAEAEDQSDCEDGDASYSADAGAGAGGVDGGWSIVCGCCPNAGAPDTWAVCDNGDCDSTGHHKCLKLKKGADGEFPTWFCCHGCKVAAKAQEHAQAKAAEQKPKRPKGGSGERIAGGGGGGGRGRERR